MSELKPTPMAHRVFDKQTGEYLQPQQHRADGKGALFIQEHVTRESFHGPFIDEIWTPAEPDRYTVERWTGLYDAKGRAVYEGDVCLLSHGYGVVAEDQEYLRWEVGGIPFDRKRSPALIKVIGTAHDEPSKLAEAASSHVYDRSADHG